MPEGTVKFFNRAKGFGFIVPDNGDKEVFLPPAAVSEAGGGKLSPGQRVSFEVVADAKGPKASALKILGEAPAPPPRPQMQPQQFSPPPPQPVRAPVSAAVSLYCDPAMTAVPDVLSALEASGHQAQMVDIVATPPSAAQMKKWSQALSAQGQELVRRNAALFFDLQLDDRFIHEDEFWTAVLQHPALLSGPILAVRDRVRICRTAADVKAFFAASDGGAQAKSKEISPRLMAMMRGEAVGPRIVPVVAEIDEDIDDELDDELEDDIEDDIEEAPAPEPVMAEAEPEPAKKPAAKAPKAVKKAAPEKKPAVKKAVAKPVVKKAVKKAK